MEMNSSRFCEVSTYAQSSGYNSSTASSSLNYIDDDHLSSSKSPEKPATNPDQSTVTKLIITITLLKVEEIEVFGGDKRRLIDKRFRESFAIMGFVLCLSLLTTFGICEPVRSRSMKRLLKGFFSLSLAAIIK